MKQPRILLIFLHLFPKIIVCQPLISGEAAASPVPTPLIVKMELFFYLFTYPLKILDPFFGHTQNDFMYFYLFFQFFAIIVFGCISSSGWYFLQDLAKGLQGKEVCVMNMDSTACHFSTLVGIVAFLASIGFLVGEWFFEQMSSIKTRKHYVIFDMAFSGLWAFFYFVTFIYMCIAWSKTDDVKFDCRKKKIFFFRSTIPNRVLSFFYSCQFQHLWGNFFCIFVYLWMGKCLLVEVKTRVVSNNSSKRDLFFKKKKKKLVKIIFLP